ncbi:MAG: hypothetical protein LLG42_14750 [Chloroflexi bacterium]|nr:hypothetical protein [Chloroflexota bacterium]
MANSKYDGVIEAVRYTPDGKVSLARAYERRGPAFSDRILLNRSELIQRLNSGEKFMIGKRLPRLGGMFEVSSKVKLVKSKDNIEWIHTSLSDNNAPERDVLEGAPLF